MAKRRDFSRDAGLRQFSPLWDNENNESLELDESKFTDPDH